MEFKEEFKEEFKVWSSRRSSRFGVQGGVQGVGVQVVIKRRGIRSIENKVQKLIQPGH